MRDLYNCNTYIVSWLDVGTPLSKSFTTRQEARQHKSKLKKRLGKKWHDYIEIKQIITTQGFIAESRLVW